MLLKTTAKVTFIQIVITVSHLLFGLSLAYFFGASEEMDAYVVASNFIIILNSLFVKAQTKTFIPFISKYKNDSFRQEIISSILKFNIVIFSLLSILVFTFSQWITYALAPGLDLNQHQLASNILKVLSIYILLSNFCSLGIGLIEYNLKFEKSALITLVQAVLLIIVLFFSARLIGVYSIPIAHISSLFMISLFYLHFYIKNGIRFRTSIKLYNTHIKKYIYLLYPIMFAFFFIWLIRFADTFIASFLDKGSISYLSYCQRIITHVSVISNAVIIIYFPILSKLNEERDNSEFLDVFYKGLQTLFTIALPISIFVVLFSKPIIMLLFERGNFTPTDTVMISKVLKYYFLVLLCSPLGAYLSNVYFCRQKPKLATYYSIFSSITNIVLNCILGFLFGIIGLAIASSVAFLVGNTLQISNIRRVNPEYRVFTSAKTLSMPFLAGLICCIVFFLANKIIFLNEYNSPLALFLYLLVNCFVFSSVFFGICFFLRVEIVLEVVDKIGKKLKKSGNFNNPL